MTALFFEMVLFINQYPSVSVSVAVSGIWCDEPEQDHGLGY
jgi:hypothetical protein